MTELTPSEFNRWLRNCVRDARKRGLSEPAIFLEVLNLVRALSVDAVFAKNRELAEMAKRGEL